MNGTAKRKPKPVNGCIIIAIYNQKGGCGKTATSMQLGGTLGRRGYNVAVVDMDRQSTASHWSARAKDTPFPATVVSLAAHQEKMVNEIEKMVELYDFILIDCPPAIESQTPWAALQIADLGLIPVTPVMDNIWASNEASELGLKAQRDNPELKLRYVVSRMKRGNIYSSCLRLLHSDPNIESFKSIIMDRNVYPESQLIGQTVHARGNKAATEEVESLTNEVLKLLGIRGK
jgi:chromosome partitioning protein